jgi:hypothetical protein
MKTILSFMIMISLSIISAMAGVSFVPKIKAKKYLESISVCHFALGLNPLPDGSVSSQVLCIGDMHLAPGTINEARGCAFGLFDLTDPGVSPAIGSNIPLVQEECSKGGFQRLLKMHMMGEEGSTVQEMLGTYRDGISATLLLSDSPMYTEAWRQSESQLKSSEKRDRARAVQEQKKECQQPKETLSAGTIEACEQHGYKY